MPKPKLKTETVTEIKPKIGRPIEWTTDRVEAIAKELEEWFLEDDTRVFYNEWLVRKGLHREHLRRFQSVSEAFRDVIKRVDYLQEERLAKLMLKPGLNPGGPIFVLKNKHNWADKVEMKNRNIAEEGPKTRNELEKMTPEQLKERLRQLTEGSR